MSDSNSPIIWDSAFVSLLQQVLVDAAMSCLGYGCFLILAIIAVRVIIRRGLSSAGRRYLLAAVLIFFVSSTVYCATDLAYELVNLTMSVNQNAVKICEGLFVVLVIFYRINYLLNDILVIWRAWVLADGPILRTILACSMLITIGCTIAEATFTIQGGIFRLSPKTTTLLLYIPLAFNNFLATSVVLYKTWIYRTQIKTHLQHVSSKSQVERVLFLLVESGFIYCGFWILLMITYVKSARIVAFVAIAALSPTAAAIYPMLIILVVEHQKSQTEQALAKPISLVIQFNSPPQPSDGQTSSSEIHSVSTINQVGFTGTTSIVQAIVDIQSAHRSKREGGSVENRVSCAPHDNDFNAVA